MTPIDADARLHALSIACLTLAYQNPRSPQSERTTEVPVGAIRLQALALYADAVEDALLLRSTATAEASVYASQLVARVIYRCFWEGHRVNLTRDAALALLTDGDLPPDVQARLRAEDVAAEEQRIRDRVDAALFASLNRHDASTAGDGGRPAWTPRRPSAVKLLTPLPRAEAVARMRRFYE